MILGTWNTRSLYRTGALEALCQETMRYRIDVLAVQETRWTGEGVYDTRTHTILHSGNKDRHEHGVAFLVDRRFKDRILNFTAINERVCVIRLKTKFFNLSIINAHAETEEKDEVTKDNFYSGLEQAFDTIPSNDIKMVIGDLNAKIGKELTIETSWDCIACMRNQTTMAYAS
ncbi:craniofacial development protein 2-like [Temnothorax curvispinosus]|uniref:Craniofacial development protein 2-like n=1 Tax=Temnothorax curvispinosus TaxID=300111 RepID=A0A6J1QV54_9HYME|nr:craniofacial development protein 2-like [Temnothorax curvispinosus]